MTETNKTNACHKRNQTKSADVSITTKIGNINIYYIIYTVIRFSVKTNFKLKIYTDFSRRHLLLLSYMN
jgi:hypothetical protein